MRVRTSDGARKEPVPKGDAYYRLEIALAPHGVITQNRRFVSPRHRFFGISRSVWFLLVNRASAKMNSTTGQLRHYAAFAQ